MLVAQSCPTLCDPMNCSPSSFSVHGILQARILEWGAILFFRGSSQLRDQTQVSHTTGTFSTIWATWASLICNSPLTDIGKLFKKFITIKPNILTNSINSECDQYIFNMIYKYKWFLGLFWILWLKTLPQVECHY